MESKRILIVEDEALISLDVREILISIGYEVPAIVTTGEEAVERIDEIASDLILMDIILAGEMDGIDAAQSIRERRDIPVVYLTSNADITTVKRARATDPYGYVLKPVEIRNLFSTIDTALSRHRLETRLRESEERYRTIYEHAIEGVYQTTPEGRYLSVNPAFAAMFGYDSPEEMIGMVRDIHTQVYVNPEDRERFKALMSTHGIVTGFEAQVKKKNGAPFWIAINGRVVRGGDGTILYYEGTNVDITRRREAEHSLREHEKLLFLITENMYDLISQTDVEGRFAYVSPSNTTVLGYEPEEMLGAHILENVHPDDIERVAEAVAKALAEKSGGRIEYRYRHRDGHYLWLETVGTLIFGDDGSITGTVFTARDVTERRQAEEALRASEEKYKSLANNIPDTIYSLDIGGIITEVNSEAQKIYGVSPQEIVGKPFAEIIHPLDRKMVLDSFQQAVRDHREYTRGLEFRIQDIHGNARWVDLHSHMHFNERGEFTGEEGVIRDITARREAEDALRQSREQIQAIFEASQAGIILVRPDGVIALANARMAEMFGLPLDELIGSPYMRFIHESEKDITRTTFDSLVASRNGMVHTERHYLRADGGDFWGYVNTKKLNGEGGGNLVAVIHDVTDQKIARESLKASVQEKEMLLREVHHRVKNNYQTIMSLLSLQAQTVADSPARRHLEEAKNRIRSMSLIHEKLYRSGDITRIDFSSYIAAIAKELSAGFMGFSQKASLATDMEKVELSIQQAIPCGMIVNELLTNAFKYAFPPEWNGAGEVRVSMKQPAPGEVEIVIADNGVGMPGGAGPGTSKTLGLSLVQMLSRQIDASLELRSSPGTSYTIRFARK